MKTLYLLIGEEIIKPTIQDRDFYTGYTKEISNEFVIILAK